MSEKIYRVQMNSKGMPNFATAEEVVMCKGCKWYNGRYCFNEKSCFPKAPNADDFCSYGERKGE